MVILQLRFSLRRSARHAFSANSLLVPSAILLAISQRIDDTQSFPLVGIQYANFLNARCFYRWPSSANLA
jgi:hypothetical protein